MKYSCDEVKTMLSLYIDDELSNSEKKFVAEHLLNCEECRNEYDELKFIASELKNMPTQPLPLDFKEKIHNRLVMESVKVKRKPLNFKIYSSIAAGLIFTVLIGTGYFQRFQPVDIAYVNDAPLKIQEQNVVAEQKQEPLPTATPTKDITPSKKPIQSKEVIKESKIAQNNTTENIVEAPKAPTEIIASTDVNPVATQQPTIAPPEAQSSDAVSSTSDVMAMRAESYASADISTAPTATPKANGVGGGGSSSGSMAKSFAAPIYKTANIKVNDFTTCASEINKKYGSIVEDDTLVLYVNDEDLENIIKITNKYNAVITYDNVSSKNDTNKCIISAK